MCHRLAAIRLVLALTAPGAVPQRWAEDGAAELLVPGASSTSEDRAPCSTGALLACSYKLLHIHSGCSKLSRCSPYINYTLTAAVLTAPVSASSCSFAAVPAPGFLWVRAAWVTPGKKEFGSRMTKAVRMAQPAPDFHRGN